MPVDIRGLSHIVLPVSNLDEALAFYRDALGLKVVMQLNPDDPDAGGGMLSGVRIAGVLLPGGTILELGEGISKKTGEAKRASPVYETEDLETLLRLVAEELPMGFTEHELREIFESLLPSWLPSSLEQSEEGSTEVDPAQKTVLRSIVREIMTSLTADDEMLLRGTFDDSLGVQDVANTLGVERQTVRNRSNALFTKFRDLLDAPTEAEADMFVQLLKEAVLNPTADGYDDG